MTAIVFTPQGQGRCLYTEAIDLALIGKLSIERASQIEFDNALQAWRVNIGGNVRYTAPTRQACLDWEHQHFNQ